MKVAFFYEMDNDAYWRDGLWAALKILARDWDIVYFNTYGDEKANLDEIYDFYLVWGGAMSRQALAIAQLPREYKKGLCFAGGHLHPALLSRFDVSFLETNWHVDRAKEHGLNAVQAFGTNTKLFRPMPEQPKLFDYIYPAAFARWKRHDRFVTKPGRKLAVGYIQPNDVESECYKLCQENGVAILPRVKYQVMPYLFNASKSVAITAHIDGGGERAVLEGLACGIDVEVEDDNPKLVRLLKEQREHLQTETDYANALREGINEVVN